jgi:predicted PhzF superfamily epimerase YddE/YHI9
VTIGDDHLINPSKGRCVGRRGRVEIEFDSDKIWLGGHAVTCAEGSLNI